LILDEVLAVGDFDFQQKCLRKIGELTKESGQTILFVSHNIQSIRSLCTKVLYLEKGSLVAQGDTDSVVAKYLLRENVYVSAQRYQAVQMAPGNELIRIQEIELLAAGKQADGPIDAADELSIGFSFWSLSDEHLPLIVSIVLVDFMGESVFHVSSKYTNFRKGLVKGACHVPANFLGSGSYVIHLLFARDQKETLWEFNQCLSFEIKSRVRIPAFINKWQSPISPDFPVILTQPN